MCLKELPMDIPKIVPPIKIKPSDVYMLVIIDADGIYHYFNDDGSYDGYSHDSDIQKETVN